MRIFTAACIGDRETSLALCLACQIEYADVDTARVVRRQRVLPGHRRFCLRCTIIFEYQAVRSYA